MSFPGGLGIAYRVSVAKYGAGLKLITLSGTSLANFSSFGTPFPNDPDRIFWLFCNRSPFQVELNFVDSWTQGQGIPLAPNGGFASMHVDEDGEAVTYQVWVASPVVPWARFTMQITHQ